MGRKHYCSVGNVADLRTGGHWFDSHCDRIHSSLTAARCFNKGYEGKQPVVWKEYRAKYCLTLSQTSPGFYMSAIQVF